MQIQELLRYAVQKLESSPTPRLDAEVLLSYLLKVPRTYLYMQPQYQLTDEQLAAFQQLLVRRSQHEPIAYIIGQREFWSLTLAVTPDTLIPRPETELLVEQALEKIPSCTAKRILDLGTGSGAIALAIAKERPQAEVYAIDKSLAALSIAKANAQSLSITNLDFLAADWLTAIMPATFDMIVSNPPYIAEQDPHLVDGDVAFEPRTALVAGVDGLAAYRMIIKNAVTALKPQGWLLLEHGYNQAEAITILLKQYYFTKVTTYVDLAGIPRIICAQKVDASM